jgi:hypothetical protein
MIPYTPPTRTLGSFNCPHCNAFARQNWGNVLARRENSDIQVRASEFSVAYCDNCKRPSFWNEENLIYPDLSTAPLPNPDLSQEIQDDYMEARSVLNKSPRSAAALLRLCIQKLCKELGASGKDIFEQIGDLVKKGLSETLKQALDTVRVIGNNAVHPGQLDLKDDREIALQLFGLVT